MSYPVMPVHQSLCDAVARGLVEGSYTMHKFGNASDVDAADVPAVIWDGTCAIIPYKIANYTYSTSADIDTLSSSNAGDTTQLIEVQGLDANWNLKIQTIQLNGQNAVILPVPLIRVFRMFNKGSTNIAGTVYLATSGRPATAGVPNAPGTTVRAIIKDGDNTTQMALYSVPKGYSAYITAGWANLSKLGAPASPASVQVQVYQRSFGGVFRVIHTLALNTNGSSGDHRPYTIPLLLPEKTDIVYKVLSTSADNLGVSAGFHAMIIRNK